jgi:hypothetical protein
MLSKKNPLKMGNQKRVNRLFKVLQVSNQMKLAGEPGKQLSYRCLSLNQNLQVKVQTKL